MPAERKHDDREGSDGSHPEGDLYGSAPDRAEAALLLIDCINDFEFEDGAALLKQALPAAGCIARLRRAAVEAAIPVIYVNDNFGRWRSDFSSLVEHCLADGVRGQAFVQQLTPAERDYFVLKPKHSGFFHTPLELLLTHLRVRHVILTGLTTNICVLFTANDAYMRGFALHVPADCVAAVTPQEHEQALVQIERVLKADVRPSNELDLRQWGLEKQEISR